MPTPFQWTFPYPSQRMPVLAGNVVATSQPLAAQAGLEILRAGGNAVDAAVATAITMTVLEPTSNGIGSDAFALVWHEGKLHGLNASGRSPKAMSIEHFAGMQTMPHLGWDAVTVPGAVSAWVALSKKFGKLPFEKLFEPAIGYAEHGFPVAPQTAAGWAAAGTSGRYAKFPEFAQTFLPGGRGPQPGERVTLPDHAKTLRLIARTQGEAFYRGELAQKIAAHAKATGGLMTADDLAAHTADFVEPISIAYRGYRLHEIPPNGQGIAALSALGILAERDLSHLDPDCPDIVHLQIEAMKLAFADAHRYVADPAAMDIDPRRLIDPNYLAARAKLIDVERAGNASWGTPKPGGTILLVAADSSGTMVSYIQSNYEGFGSGIVIPNTGISLQNRGGCFTLEKNHPNQIAGGKRPYHTIIPAFLTRPSKTGGEEPLMAFGVMGGFMQPQGHLQVASRVIDFAQNPQAALDAPRWQITDGLHVSIEPGFPKEVYEELRKRGHTLTIAPHRTVTFGGGQAVYRMESGDYLGASDARRDGQAVGF
jgi:gamma-glutamyltranspeptidase / glutathione hydrolase